MLPFTDSVFTLASRSAKAFDSSLAANYGLPGVHRLFYETQIKPFAHPDAIRYVESVLATSEIASSNAQVAQ